MAAQVLRRAEPDEVSLRRRRPRLVELDDADSPALEHAQQDRRPVVGLIWDGDGPAGLEEREDEGRDRAGAGREEERGAALELAEGTFGLDPDRMGVALVVELARLAVLERPDR